MITYADGIIAEVKNIVGKTRVAPLEKMSISNLEIHSATNWANFSKFVKGRQDNKINRITLEIQDDNFTWDQLSKTVPPNIFCQPHQFHLGLDFAKQLEIHTQQNNPDDDGNCGYKS